MNWLRGGQPGAQWISAGLASSFPNLDQDYGNLLEPRMCNAVRKPGCRVFQVPKADPSQASEVLLSEHDEPSALGEELKEQVVVFQYKGKFHAVDHRCPHSSYPLSRGMPFDIEDFGVVLSAGLTCPKHSWSFDLITGMSDRAAYKLGVWEVKLEDVHGSSPSGVADTTEATGQANDKMVWVRRKQKMG